MKPTIREDLSELVEDALFLDPPETYDGCIVGIADRAGGMSTIAYDRERCIEALVTAGMDREEAEEFFEFNTIGAWVGERTPVFITTLKDFYDRHDGVRRFHIDVRNDTQFAIGDMEWAQVLVTLNMVLQQRWPHISAHLEEAQ